MLSVLRLMTMLIGAGTAYYCLMGAYPGPIFTIPGYVAAGALALSALMPRSAAPPAMLTANGLSLGVFLVALMAYVEPGRAVDLKLIAAMAANLVVILLLHPRGN